MSRAQARVAAVIRGFWAMRVIRSRMLLLPPVMVVAVCISAAGEPAVATTPMRVRP